MLDLDSRFQRRQRGFYIFAAFVVIAGAVMAYFQYKASMEICQKYYPELSPLTCVMSSKAVALPHNIRIESK
jgi:hypothetical protein